MTVEIIINYSDDGQEIIINYYGSAIKYSTEELTDFAELIVLGTTGVASVVQKRPVESPNYPEYLKEVNSNRIHDIKIIPFNVAEYIKGDGPDIVNVAIDGNSVEPLIEEKTQYVLYLEQPESEASKEYWEYAYKVAAGRQGVWKVRNGTAHQEFLDGYSVELSDLKK